MATVQWFYSTVYLQTLQLSGYFPENIQLLAFQYFRRLWNGSSDLSVIQTVLALDWFYNYLGYLPATPQKWREIGTSQYSGYQSRNKTVADVRMSFNFKTTTNRKLAEIQVKYFQSINRQEKCRPIPIGFILFKYFSANGPSVW